MSVEKPSETENEYFKKADLERIARIRRELDKQRARRKAQQQRELHWMRCPKCGATMDEVLFRHVKVDRCPSCNYVGFDGAELGLLLGHDEPVLIRLAEELKRMFSLGRVGADPMGDDDQ